MFDLYRKKQKVAVPTTLAVLIPSSAHLTLPLSTLKVMNGTVDEQEAAEMGMNIDEQKKVSPALFSVPS